MFELIERFWCVFVWALSGLLYLSILVSVLLISESLGKFPAKYFRVVG